MADDTIHDGCGFDRTNVDAVKITIVYESNPSNVRRRSDDPILEPRELGRRTFTQDCKE
jgi:hypothetical protein